MLNTNNTPQKVDSRTHMALMSLIWGKLMQLVVDPKLDITAQNVFVDQLFVEYSACLSLFF